MSKRTGMCLFVILVLAITVNCNLFGQDRGQIVYQAAGEDGKPASEVVVCDTGGKELRRVTLPGEVGLLQPMRFTLGRHVLYQDAIATQKWFLVDTVSGEVKAFDTLPAQPYAASDSQVLLCGREGVYILDVDAGEIQDVPIEIDPANPVPPLVEAVRSGDPHFLVQISGEFWLVPASNPEAARQLGLERGARSAAVSDDGKYVVYIARDENGETHAYLETIDGFDSKIVLSGSDIVGAAFVPKRDQIVLVRRELVLLYALDDQTETEFFAPIDVVRELHIDPEGKQVVLGIGGLKTEMTWTKVDLDKGTEQELDELAGYQRVYRQASSRWLFLTDDRVQKNEIRIASLDLETAQMREHASLEGVKTLNWANMSQDGCVALVLALLENGEMQIWLLVADQDDAVLLAESRIGTVYASLSPDGKWVAISERKENDRQPMTIKLVATGSSKEQVVGQGFISVWAKP
ncbi:MAG: hypothetical protein JXA89_12675 [Anaerolineae bacterium]|nr:hypothetical protein [Anaerolineae bacterium]